VRSQQIFSAGCSELPQATLCDFLVEGHFARHLHSHAVRGAPADTRAALEQRLGAAMDFAELPGGLHLIGGIRGDDRAIAAAPMPPAWVCRRSIAGAWKPGARRP
jgi:GntR family transcriptional regulator/MocR family aminotransferase